MTIERPMLPPAADSPESIIQLCPPTDRSDEALTSEAPKPAGNVIEFPGNPPAEGFSKAYIDKLHSEAFRDLEGSLSQCVKMSSIAAQLMSDADDGKDSNLMFAVFHLNSMLDALNAEYYARWHGERRG